MRIPKQEIIFNAKGKLTKVAFRGGVHKHKNDRRLSTRSNRNHKAISDSKD